MGVTATGGFEHEPLISDVTDTPGAHERTQKDFVTGFAHDQEEQGHSYQEYQDAQDRQHKDRRLHSKWSVSQAAKRLQG
jgi:hypothetical protein